MGGPSCCLEYDIRELADRQMVAVIMEGQSVPWPRMNIAGRHWWTKVPLIDLANDLASVNDHEGSVALIVHGRSGACDESAKARN